MSLTLAQSITEVRDILNEASAVFWTDSQITKWIQEGTRIFSSKTLLVEDTQTVWKYMLLSTMMARVHTKD